MSHFAVSGCMCMQSIWTQTVLEHDCQAHGKPNWYPDLSTSTDEAEIQQEYKTNRKWHTSTTALIAVVLKGNGRIAEQGGGRRGSRLPPIQDWKVWAKVLGYLTPETRDPLCLDLVGIKSGTFLVQKQSCFKIGWLKWAEEEDVSSRVGG